MSKDDRDSKVLAVLQSASEPLGPTKIASIINEPWCCSHGYGSSATIVPVLRRIGAKLADGHFGKYIAP